MSGVNGLKLGDVRPLRHSTVVCGVKELEASRCETSTYDVNTAHMAAIFLSLLKCRSRPL